MKALPLDNTSHCNGTQSPLERMAQMHPNGSCGQSLDNQGIYNQQGLSDDLYYNEKHMGSMSQIFSHGPISNIPANQVVSGMDINRNCMNSMPELQSIPVPQFQAEFHQGEVRYHLKGDWSHDSSTKSPLQSPPPAVPLVKEVNPGIAKQAVEYGSLANFASNYLANKVPGDSTGTYDVSPEKVHHGINQGNNLSPTAMQQKKSELTPYVMRQGTANGATMNLNKYSDSEKTSKQNSMPTENININLITDPSSNLELGHLLNNDTVSPPHPGTQSCRTQAHPYEELKKILPPNCQGKPSQAAQATRSDSSREEQNKSSQSQEKPPGTCFTEEVNPSLAELPLHCNGSLAKPGLTSSVEQALDEQERPRQEEQTFQALEEELDCRFAIYSRQIPTAVEYWKRYYNTRMHNLWAALQKAADDKDRVEKLKLEHHHILQCTARNLDQHMMCYMENSGSNGKMPLLKDKNGNICEFDVAPSKLNPTKQEGNDLKETNESFWSITLKYLNEHSLDDVNAPEIIL